MCYRQISSSLMSCLWAISLLSFVKKSSSDAIVVTWLNAIRRRRRRRRKQGVKSNMDDYWSMGGIRTNHTNRHCSWDNSFANTTMIGSFFQEHSVSFLHFAYSFHFQCMTSVSYCVSLKSRLTRKSCMTDFFLFSSVRCAHTHTRAFRHRKPSVRTNDELLIDVIWSSMASAKSSLLKNVVYDSRNDVPTGKKRAGCWSFPTFARKKRTSIFSI